MRACDAAVAVAATVLVLVTRNSRLGTGLVTIREDEQTAETITPDGWLRTGDIAVMNEDGYIDITDRKKDMFIMGGFNAYPAEIERMMVEHPEGGIASVIGVPDERWVEVGRAIVVLPEGAELDETTVINHCRANLARFKVPQSVVFIDEIPHNATGKVLKRELRDSYGS